jgi:hypothetical protein
VAVSHLRIAVRTAAGLHSFVWDLSINTGPNPEQTARFLESDHPFFNGKLTFLIRQYVSDGMFGNSNKAIAQS